MSRYSFTSLLAILLLVNLGCQKDDICPLAVETTPLVTVSFFDFNDTDVPKPPVNLRIKAPGVEEVLFDRVNTSEVVIPLRTDADITEYNFILNAPAAPEGATGNTDRVIFSYGRNEVYINRACSFKVEYIDLRATVIQDENNWIRTILVVEEEEEEENIENETNPRIIIYH